MIRTAFLIIFTGFSVNLAVQFGLGIKDILSTKQCQWRYPLYKGIVLFFSVIVTCLIFTIVLYPLGLGFLETLLVLPLSILFASLIEKAVLFLFLRWIRPVQTSVFSAYNGLVFGASFFALKTAESFWEIIIMAAGFSIGYVLSMAILQEIHKRSFIEAVPVLLRGAPLMLISLGLLSLVCSAAAFFLQAVHLF